MSMRKFANYVNENLPLIVGLGLIVSIHWGWYQLQQVPYLVKDSEKKDLPPVIAAKYLQRKIFGLMSTSSSAETVAQESE